MRGKRCKILNGCKLNMMWNILMINEYLSRIYNWYNKTNRFKSAIANLSPFSQNIHIALAFFHVILIILFWFFKVIYATYRNSLPRERHMRMRYFCGFQSQLKENLLQCPEYLMSWKLRKSMPSNYPQIPCSKNPLK